jgi:two-component system, OmpR family, phosphate regulon sensor histidine kinase PhoR
MRLRTHHKLFLSYGILVGAVVLLLVVGVNATLRPPLLEYAEAELLRELELGREIFDGSPQAEPDSLARHVARLTGHRVTVVAPDGRVLGDSGVDPGLVSSLENHAGRPEVQEARAQGVGTSVRFSSSVGRDLLYAAMVTRSGPTLRFAVGIEAIDEALAGFRRRILQVGAVAFLLAALLTLGFSLGLTRPLRRMVKVADEIAGGNLNARVRMSRSDELGELGRALDSLAAELQRRLGQLEGEREEMTALIDSMVEGVLAVEPDGTLRRANPAARAIFDLPERLEEGTRPESIARRQAFLQLVDDALAGRQIHPTELTLGEKSLLATAQPLPRGGAVLVFLDTTELRRLEGVRRDFVANASHELKTPLTVIRGNAETLADEGLDPELRRRFTESLKVNADRLQSILDDLLDLSRIESGGWAPEPEVVSLSAAVGRAWEPFADAAGEKGVELHAELGEGAATVHVDPSALNQVLSNLFSNALRYTPSGGRITVRSRVVRDGWVRIEVEDTGTGIPAAHLTRIFERFYRVDPARSRAEGGTGLGLSIVRHLVERHGGRVKAQSRPGEGTTILVSLPFPARAVPGS